MKINFNIIVVFVKLVRILVRVFMRRNIHESFLENKNFLTLINFLTQLNRIL
jgi:hypothetical protein